MKEIRSQNAPHKHTDHLLKPPNKLTINLLSQPIVDPEPAISELSDSFCDFLNDLTRDRGNDVQYP